MRREMLRSAVAGCVLAMAATAAVVPGTLSPNQKFVNKLYSDLLNRTPGPPESAAIVKLLGFGITRVQIAGMVTSSNEYRANLVQQLYNSFLHRAATAQEVNAFVGFLQQGVTDDDVKAAILGSDEYFHLVRMSTAGFLNQLYEDVLGRPVDPAALLTFGNLLGQGTTRQAVASLVLKSLEADQREITQLFQKLLKRPPQPFELNNFAQMLQTGVKDEVVIDSICGSAEYFQLAQ